MDLREFVCEMLGISLDIGVRTNLGLLFENNPKVAPKAYNIKINDPLNPEEIAALSTIAKGADTATLSDLFSAFNGLSMGFNKFDIYGLVKSLDRSDIFSVQNVPFNIEVIQTYGRPEYAPPNGLIVGVSEEKNEDGAGGSELYHLIDSEGRICIGPFKETSEIEYQFEDLESWLESEICKFRDSQSIE